MTQPVLDKALRFFQRNINRQKREVLNIIDQILLSKVLSRFVSPNFRAKIAWASHRKEIDDLENLYAFWRQKAPQGNLFAPHKSSPRSQTIITMIKTRITPNDKILEVGCNVGRKTIRQQNAR